MFILADHKSRNLSSLSTTKKLRNHAEELFRNHALIKGWNPCKRGWPDFICEKNGRIRIVEVKPRYGSSLKKEQRFIMEALSAYGVPCFVFSPDGGLVSFEDYKDEKEK